MNSLYLLDLFGTCIFAITGAYKGIKYGFNIWGTIVLAIITGIGGGTIREIIIKQDLPFIIEDHNYVLLALLIAVTMFYYKRCTYFINKAGVFYILDIFALGIFVAIGAERAFTLNLGLINMILMGVLTGIGGGLMRDIIVKEIPCVFKPKDYYILTALLGAFLFTVLIQYLPEFIVAPFCIFCACLFGTITKIKNSGR